MKICPNLLPSPNADSKENVTAIQGMRNGELGATILATAAAQLAQRTFATLTNPAYLNAVKALGESDPIAGGACRAGIYLGCIRVARDKEVPDDQQIAILILSAN